MPISSSFNYVHIGNVFSSIAIQFITYLSRIQLKEWRYVKAGWLAVVLDSNEDCATA